MTPVQVTVEAVACLGLLVLVLIALVRRGQSPLRLPIVLLCVDLFTWNAATLATDLTHSAAWRFVDRSTSPLTTPLVLEFVLAFVGQRRRFRWLRIGCFAAFGLLAAMPALALVVRLAPPWPDPGSRRWGTFHLAAMIPVVSFCLFELVVHLRGVFEPEERARTRLILASIAVGALLGSTEMLGYFIPAVPSLGPLGMLVASAITTVAALRLRLLEKPPSARTLARMVGFAALAVLAYVALFESVAAGVASLVFGAVALSLSLMGATLAVSARAARRRARQAQLLLLGRFSAQMAHDLKNPLAAVKGAAQVVEEDLSRRQAGSVQRDMVQVLLDQVTRLEQTLARYERLARVEVSLEPLRLDALVHEVLALLPLPDGNPVELETELAELPPCRADREMLAAALENLVRNAVEAMPGGGKISVRTSARGQEQILAVEDDGPGMDARTREQAFDELFTTKATGSGLGLAFVQRVAHAHGGSVFLRSQPGRGTLVELRLPVR